MGLRLCRKGIFYIEMTHRHTITQDFPVTAFKDRAKKNIISKVYTPLLLCESFGFFLGYRKLTYNRMS